MLGALLGLFNPLSSIANKIADAYVARQVAMTDRERVAADVLIHTLEAKRDALIKEPPWSFNSIIRGVLTLPVAILLWKLLVWDKALGQWTSGHTDALSSEIWYVCMVALGFYFIHDTVRAWRK